MDYAPDRKKRRGVLARIARPSKGQQLDPGFYRNDGPPSGGAGKADYQTSKQAIGNMKDLKPSDGRSVRQAFGESGGQSYTPKQPWQGFTGTTGAPAKGPNLMNGQNIKEKLAYLRQRRNALAASPVTQTVADGTTVTQSGSKQQDKIDFLRQQQKKNRRKNSQSYTPS